MKLILLALMGVVGSQALRAHPKFMSDEAAKNDMGDDKRRYGPFAGQENGPFFLSDADHPGAHRKFEFLPADKVKVTGDDGEGTKEWTVEGELDEDGVFALDFSPQGGPKELTAHFKGRRIEFYNGMEWHMTAPEAVAADYSDPNHPGCPRKLRVEGSARVVLTGADQIEGAKDCKDGKHGPTFEIKGHMDGKDLHMDFSPKGGPKDLTGEFSSDIFTRDGHVEIDWEDGNRWRELREGEDTEDTQEGHAN